MSGIFGAVSKSNCSRTVFYGTDYHSHLGTEYGGMCLLGDKFSRHIHSVAQSQFKSRFFDHYHKMEGNKGIGVISDSNVQPIYLNSKFGPFALVTAGLIENKHDLKKQLFEKGITFAEEGPGGLNSTELIAKIICLGENFVEGIEKVFDIIEGSCSILLLHKDGIYAARDRLGYTSLVIGKNGDDWAVASESNSLPNLDFTIEKFMEPGEIVLLTDKGLKSQKEGRNKQQICAFLWIYTGFPASTYEGVNAEEVRERCGAALAKRDADINADVAAGVPDSGSAHAIGYAQESKVPYRRPLVKYTPGYGRSYTPPSQETRDLVAKMKLIPIKAIIENNKIVICDDSIVRGTQLKNFTVKKLWDNGAKEIHVRPACPPLMYPCKFCLSTRNIDELVARKAIKAIEEKDIEDVSEYLEPGSEKYDQMLEWIRKDIEVTTLRYQTVDDMVEAIGVPKEKLCLYCWTGECPSAPSK